MIEKEYEDWNIYACRYWANSGWWAGYVEAEDWNHADERCSEEWPASYVEGVFPDENQNVSAPE